MEISKSTWIILFVSIFVGLIIMIATFIIMRLKINKVKYEVIIRDSKLGNYNKAISRKSTGELLWNLKDKCKNPLQDEQLDFLINIAMRNEYKTFNIINASSNYEEISLTKLANLKKAILKPDLVILFNENLNSEFDKVYKMLKLKQMIAIVNAIKKDQKIKKLLSYLKLIKARHENVKIGNGIILVVK